MIKRILLALGFCGLWASGSEAKPLLIQWTTYQPNAVAVERFMLYRGVNGGPLQPYVSIWDVTATAYVDNAVKSNRTYCFRMRAVTETGGISALSNQVCARPLR